MLTIDILASGQARKTPFLAAQDDYIRRITRWPCKITEYDGERPGMQAFLEGRLIPDSVLIACDEQGKTMPSREFAALLGDLADAGERRAQFLIGGADGIPAPVKTKARHTISFGRQTWPHVMARIMLLEQIYRAQQILLGHPYHRD